MAVVPAKRSMGRSRAGGAVLSDEMQNDMFSERPDRFHHLFVRYRPELLHAHHVIQPGDFLNVLDLNPIDSNAASPARTIRSAQESFLRVYL
jgi:hypothetical protein